MMMTFTVAPNAIVHFEKEWKPGSKVVLQSVMGSLCEYLKQVH